MKILFLLRSLNRGGAERQMVTLATALHRRGHDITVAVFYGGGPLQQTLDEAGVPLIDLRKAGRWDTMGFARRLVTAVRSVEPDVLYTCLTVPNLLGVLLRPLWPGVAVVWGIRASNVDWSQYDRLQQLTAALEGQFARWADLAVCNSVAGREHALGRGFPPQRAIVIYNGVDVDRFQPSAAARARTRAEWQIAPDEIVAGIVARLDVMKDHETFLRAAALLAATTQGVRFVIVGDGEASAARRLHALADSLGLGDRAQWLPGRSDIEQIYPAFDLHVSSSRSEGFSNVIAEAMACGVPCAVTNVGDSAHIVGDTGEVAPSGDPQALALAILRQIGRLSPELCAEARARIVQNFSVERLVVATEVALEAVIARTRK